MPFILGTVMFFSMDLPPQGPHEGIVKKSEGYYIEMKNDPDTVILAYLLSGKMKTISNKGITGSVKLFFSDTTAFDVKLNPITGDAFRARVTPGFYGCKITFDVLGKEISARFEKQEQFVKKK